ncbi:MAG: type II secretion system GspH family protein [Thermoanaerobaculales bacterium]|nr:type II secretion system GspH family protein [Thermoanaerobaculales bacterium]
MRRSSRKVARQNGGFTLVELLIVVAIVGILAAVAMPNMVNAPRRAREAVLKEDLYQIRSCIDQHLGDKGAYPASLQALVDAGYLRFMPIDPITKSAETWVEVSAEAEDLEDLEPFEEDLSGGGGTGIIDVFSGASGLSLDGIPYSEF